MKNYLVIGLGKFGRTIAKTLYQNGNNVLAVDSNEEITQSVVDSGEVEDAVTLDVTNEQALINIAKDNFDTAFVCIGSNVQDSILVTITLKELGIKNIICKAKTKTHGKVLSKIGASQVVYPEELMGEKIALSAMRPSVIEFFKFSDQYSIYEIKVPEFFVGKSLANLNLRRQYSANVIAMKDGNGILDVTPDPYYEFCEDDVVIILGRNDRIEELIK